jgi:mannose-1-phosphate guanylyltransferase/mannose-6-phosphate isomerase
VNAAKKKLIVPVILSGGMGTRLWPMSRGNYPKQFLSLGNSENSLIQETVLRVRDEQSFLPPVIICNEAHRFLVAEKLREIGMDKASIMLEPCGRNTAPAVALAAHFISKKYDNAIMLVLPSDHIITNKKAFLEGVDKALDAAEQDYLVTFGITPTAPDTGYGYIKLGKALVKKESYKVDKFVEKPDLKTAKGYLDSGDYVWNSGMFCFSADIFLQELEQYQPEMSRLLKQTAQTFEEGQDFVTMGEDAFGAIAGESIDYAVMEHTQRAAVVPVECGWTDAGSWDALWQIKNKDDHGNVTVGEADLLDSKNCYVSCSDGVRVAALGVENLIIISTKDCIMVADKSRAQDVKDLVGMVKQTNPNLVENHRYVYRPWGLYDSIDNGKRHQVKRIVVKPGAKLSLQMHYHRAEHWVVVSGTAIVTRGAKEEVVTENQSVYIPYGETHRLENPGKIPLELIEVQSGSYLGEDDIVRFQDSYGRSK